jgi:hypothetical protein
VCMVLNEAYTNEAHIRASYEFGPSKEKAMAAEVQRLTQIFSPYLESFKEIKISEKESFPTDLECFVFIEVRDRALEAVERFRDTFKPGDHPDPIFAEKLADLKDNLQIQRLKAIGGFVESKLRRSDQKTYQEAMAKGAERTLKYILAGNVNGASNERRKILRFQVTQQVREEIGVMAALGIPVDSATERETLTVSNTQVMVEADKPFGFLFEQKEEFSDEARNLAAAMDKHYNATNSLINKVAEEGIQVLDDPNGVMKDATFEPDASTGVGTFTGLGSIEGTDWSGNPFVVEFDERGAVKNPGLEKNDKLVAKNVVGIIAADRLLVYASSVGVSKEEVLDLFLLATRQDAKNLLNLVKTFCDTLFGHEPESLAPGLKTFADLSISHKKVFVDALFKANAGWKVSPEDEAIYETLQELHKPDNIRSMEDVFAEKAKKRIGSGAMGLFIDMMKAKQWTEVAKDLFQVCQGLVQLEVGNVDVRSNGMVGNMLKEKPQQVSKTEEIDSLAVPA